MTLVEALPSTRLGNFKALVLRALRSERLQALELLLDDRPLQGEATLEQLGISPQTALQGVLRAVPCTGRVFNKCKPSSGYEVIQEAPRAESSEKRCAFERAVGYRALPCKEG